MIPLNKSLSHTKPHVLEFRNTSSILLCTEVHYITSTRNIPAIVALLLCLAYSVLICYSTFLWQCFQYISSSYRFPSFCTVDILNNFTVQELKESLVCHLKPAQPKPDWSWQATNNGRTTQTDYRYKSTATLVNMRHSLCEYINSIKIFRRCIRLFVINRVLLHICSTSCLPEN